VSHTDGDCQLSFVIIDMNNVTCRVVKTARFFKPVNCEEKDQLTMFTL